jgi:hypothetical protein
MFQFSNLLSLVVTLFVLILIWVGSIVYTYWDVSRRPLQDWQKIAWLVVAAVLPILGLLIYLVARFLRPAINSRKQEEGVKRVTLPFHVEGPADPDSLRLRKYGDVQRPPGMSGSPTPGHLPTIAAVQQQDIHSSPSSMEDHFSGPGAGETIAAVPSTRIPNTAPLELNALSLYVAEGPQAGKTYAIDQFPADIGRGQQAAICLSDDPAISRRHAEILRQEGQVYIRDLNSTHGTQVNGNPIFHQRLSPGDHIQVGSTVLVVQSVRPQPAPDPRRRP